MGVGRLEFLSALDSSLQKDMAGFKKYIGLY
jgi:hypothetical protein